MIEVEPGESRPRYLMRVAVEFIRRNSLEEYTVRYDGTECDGSCLAGELENEVEGMPLGEGGTAPA